MDTKEQMADALIAVVDMFEERPDLHHLCGPAEDIVLAKVARALNAYNAELPTADDVRGILRHRDWRSRSTADEK
jgi:hypothetical protein